MLLFAVVFYVAGTSAQAGWVLLLAAVAIASLVWSFWSLRRTRSTTSARYDAPDRATAGVPVPVHLHLRSDRAGVAVVHDPTLNLAGAVRLTTDGTELDGFPVLDRGELTHGHIHLRVTDPLGLFVAKLEAKVPVAAVVLPAVPDVRRAGGGGGAMLDPAETRRGAGHGSEVVGVRDYQRGDPLRQVHWRTTARTGQVVVRDLAADDRPRLRVEIAGGAWERRSLDRACEAACGLAQAASRRGHPVVLALDGETLPWGPEARTALATLPPHSGAASRPLSVVPADPAGALTVRLSPAAAPAPHQDREPDVTTATGVRLDVSDGSSGSQLSADADLVEVARRCEALLPRMVA